MVKIVKVNIKGICSDNDIFGQFKFLAEPKENINPQNQDLYNYIIQNYGAPNYLKNNKTINMFAYGFSGSGKTYTLIEGNDEDKKDKETGKITQKKDLSILKLFIQDLTSNKFEGLSLNEIKLNVYYPLINNNVNEKNMMSMLKLKYQMMVKQFTDILKLVLV